VTGRLLQLDPWIVVGFGRGNVLVVTPVLTQVTEPSELEAVGLDPARFGIVALKSRVHFRRGFVDGGLAHAVVLVEPDEPFLGTTSLGALPYRHVELAQYYPYGCDDFQPVVVVSGARASA
jgi:microcystin degradation protein MlrC